MASVNKVILIGNLGRDPEMRYMPSGEAVALLSIATTEVWKDRSGQKQERTDWHRVEFIGRQAEVAGEYLKKGSPVYVEGSLRYDQWEDKNTGEKKYTTKIRGDRMQLLGSRGASAGGGGDYEGGGDSWGGGGGGGGRGQSSSYNDGGFSGGNDGGFSGGNDRPARSAPPQRPAPQSAPKKPAGDLGDFDDDIPF